MIRTIRRDPIPARRIMDIGCGMGGVLEDIRHKLGVEAIGVELKPLRSISTSIKIYQADAIRDPLPSADVAFAMHLGHHLSESDLVDLICNVGRFSRRFIILDLVRHPLPLARFRVLVVPFVCQIAAVDGQKSIRRSYTPTELRRITASALADSGSSFRHSVAPLYARQTIDIVYAK
jgi:SAM-dependent methyltransferase